ncbi:MAG: hypothetical protein DMD58_02275 [Gemmatimonadetes bacterium]|nr:MAG: hypothetical protein DMD58_02275 [Gemmatimonadota bacterium]
MTEDMGTFRIDIEIENPARPGERRTVGSALVHAAGRRTTDDVVFGEHGDLVLLGARSLEGLNYRVDPLTKRLVDAGPAPAAVVA